MGQYPDRTAILVDVVLASLNRHAAAQMLALAEASGWDGLVSFLEFFCDEQLSRLDETPQRAASQRLLRLALSSVTTRPVLDGDSKPDEDVLTLRHTLGHDVAGLPREE